MTAPDTASLRLSGPCQRLKDVYGEFTVPVCEGIGNENLLVSGDVKKGNI